MTKARTPCPIPWCPRNKAPGPATVCPCRSTSGRYEKAPKYKIEGARTERFPNAEARVALVIAQATALGALDAMHQIGASGPAGIESPGQEPNAE